MPRTDPLLRQWTLLQRLSARRQGASLQELAQECGRSEKTVQRDLKLFHQLGFAVCEQRAAHGRKLWSLDQDHGIGSLRFTLEEAAALYLGRQFLEAFAGTLLWRGAHSAFRKLQSAFGDAATHHLEQVARSVYLKASAQTDYSARADLIDQLMIAIEERRLTVITYQSLRATEPVTLYDIHPYALVHYRGSLYVLGRSCEHNAVRTFKVDRISAVHLEQLIFPPAENFDPADLLANSFGVFAGQGAPTRIRVRFSAKVQRILQEKQFHASQRLSPQPDGSTIATFELSSVEEFLSWVLSFGPEAEVLEPEELRDRITESLASALKKYSGQPDPPSPLAPISRSPRAKQRGDRPRPR